jgi:hypothetical protein
LIISSLLGRSIRLHVELSYYLKPLSARPTRVDGSDRRSASWCGRTLRCLHQDRLPALQAARAWCAAGLESWCGPVRAGHAAGAASALRPGVAHRPLAIRSRCRTRDIPDGWCLRRATRAGSRRMRSPRSAPAR